jgi:Cd2+/Zn2+-exporting ATPase
MKGSNYLEALNKLESIAFDKTGTLTKGTFNVTKIEGDILEDAALAESFSNHPIAKSILNHYAKDIDQSKVEEHSEIEGLGVRAKINTKTVLAGNAKLMKSEQIEIPKINELGTIVYVAIDGKYKGYILISDEIKEESKEAVSSLNKRNLNTFMLTGDNTKTANIVADSVGIKHVYANLLPNEKVELFEDIQEKSNGLTAFVGDGINDAPVLRRADIGIAMGGIGSDAAIEAADIVLMEDSPAKISLAIKIAAKTRKIVTQNIVFALGIKIIVMILGVFGLANMWGAIFADVGVALLAILNSMRVLRD